jgi:transmembrane sensor
MNNDPADPSSRAEQEASLWAARLDGAELSPAETSELEAWLQASPERRRLLTEYCQFSSDLESSLPALVAQGHTSMPAVAAASARPRRLWWLAGASAGLAAAAACALLLLRPSLPAAPALQSYATSACEQRTVDLPDGTRVELNAQSNLLVEPFGRERRVRLAAGQAFFSVAKDSTRPFAIETPAGSVHVTGTAFDVTSEPGCSLRVTVSEGAVLVRPATADGTPSAAPVALTAGDLLHSAPPGLSVRHLAPEELESRLAWRQGRAVFEDTPLREALSQFSQYHGRGLSATPAAAALRVGGRYSLSDLDGFLSSLEEILPVHVARDLNGSVRISLRGEP